jgi:hypothetical protein
MVTKEQIKQFLMNNPELYQMIITFTPMQVDLVLRKLSQGGMYVDREELVRILDSLNIFVTNSRKDCY